MATENVEHRALAAIRFLDEETRLPVQGPVKVEGGGVKLVRNLSGFHVITDAPGFSDYAASFDLPQAPPPVASFTLTVTDPSRTYLARRFTVQLPRDPAPGPDEALPANSVFRPVDVVLFPSPVARASAGSAVVRLRVEDTNGEPLPYALVELTLDTPSIQRRGLCDERGEALVLMPGVPIANWADPEATTEFDVTVKAAWTADAPPPNPDALVAALQNVAGTTIEVAAGTETSKTIQLEWVEL
jgi:hypothetical protein